MQEIMLQDDLGNTIDVMIFFFFFWGGVGFFVGELNPADSVY